MQKRQVKVLHSRDLHFAVKEHGGKAIQYLMKRFGFETEEILFDAIKKVTPSEAETLIREMKNKAKKDQKRKKTESGSVINMGNKNTQPINLVPEKGGLEVAQRPKPEEVNSERGASNERKEAPKKENTNHTKAALMEQEEQISADLCGLELKYKQEKQKRAAIRKEAAQAQRAAEELARLLNAQRENVCSIVERYNASGTRMESLTREMNPLRAALENLRIQIAELDKVTILVYQNGEIEVENAEVPLVSDEEITENLIRLVSMPVVGKITIDELKAIAKLLKMVEMYETNGTPFELEFDSTEVQRLWETVTNA